MARQLTPVEVLDVLIARLEKRAETLDAVRLLDYRIAQLELLSFARMLKNARAYLEGI